MKTNAAPEKIHIQPNAHDGWFEGKIPNGLPDGLFVEYTRTDAFIEKAAIWFNDYFASHDVYGVIAPFYTVEEMFEDFKKYMNR
jgi:hypothetical protein